ncbi:hypothetical protein Agub_g10971, partial [Astrephomene gubernaculifera]
MQVSRLQSLARNGLRAVLMPVLETSPLVADPLAAASLSLARSEGVPSTSGTSAGCNWQSTASCGGLSWVHGRCISTTSPAAAAASKKGSGKRQSAPGVEEQDPGLIKVILRKDNRSLGRRGDVVLVKRGLMRHELYPKGEAAYATPENIAKYALTKAEAESQSEDQEGALEKLLKALDRKSVIVTRRPLGADSEHFADPAVSPRLVLEAVERQLGIRLHSSHLLLDGKIDSYGTYKVPLNLRLT